MTSEEEIVKLRTALAEAAGEIDALKARLDATPTSKDTVSVFCGRPEVGETHFK